MHAIIFYHNFHIEWHYSPVYIFSVLSLDLCLGLTFIKYDVLNLA